MGKRFENGLVLTRIGLVGDIVIAPMAGTFWSLLVGFPAMVILTWESLHSIYKTRLARTVVSIGFLSLYHRGGDFFPKEVAEWISPT